MYVNGNGDVGELSEQEVVSCDTSDSGCNGGDPATAWDWIKSHGGLTTAASYPYTQYATTKVATPGCNQALSAASKSVLTASGTPVALPKTSSSAAQILASETAIMQQIYAGYPVTFQIAASSSCFNNYVGGVMSCSCGGAVDHVVLAIGWTPTYFIIRNQWLVLRRTCIITEGLVVVLTSHHKPNIYRGTSWGISGYAYLPRGMVSFDHLTICTQ